MAKRRTRPPQLTVVSRILKNHLTDLHARHGITSLKIFGSIVRGEGTRRSDVDLLVEFAPGHVITLLRFVAIERELSELLGFKVDLVEPSALKPNIGRRILSEAVPV